MLKSFVYSVAVFFFAHPVFSQDFSIIKFNRGETNYVHYQGTMTREGIFSLLTAMEVNGITNLSINSVGGDIAAGRALNYFIEENDISVFIDDFSVCISACAFAVMASDHIESKNSDLYFHKPFFSYIDPSTTLSQIGEYSELEILSMVDLFAANGYNYQLLKEIYTNTDKEFFLRISVENLAKFKTGFMEEIEAPEQYYTIEGF